MYYIEVQVYEMQLSWDQSKSTRPVVHKMFSLVEQYSITWGLVRNDNFQALAQVS